MALARENSHFLTNGHRAFTFETVKLRVMANENEGNLEMDTASSLNRPL